MNKQDNWRRKQATKPKCMIELFEFEKLNKLKNLIMFYNLWFIECCVTWCLEDILIELVDGEWILKFLDRNSSIRRTHYRFDNSNCNESSESISKQKTIAAHSQSKVKVHDSPSSSITQYLAYKFLSFPFPLISAIVNPVIEWM